MPGSLDVKDLKPQERLVWEYLLTGRTLTNLVALTNLGVGSLTSRIAELRRRGGRIESDWEEDHFHRRYKRYWVAKDGAER